ncbi:phenoloxidase 2-like [Lutzomyia longipalpis]|uniref:phenoloxidase 2-like n=1 Tax=Lutzomyia longipalpis TaxID=7200 RepID=UPI002483E279|nr:phenoloxidase 2-like [Lutzomyia longipalpis]
MDEKEVKNCLLLLFDRPQEPVFVGKGKRKKVVFDVPQKYLSDQYRPLGAELQNRFGEMADDRIPVKNISLPDLKFPMGLKRHEQFSLFIPYHVKMAARLIDIFMGMRNVDELLSVAVYARDRLNPYLFNYALSVALLHREDTQDVPIPNYVETFPDKFVDSAVFVACREEAAIVPEDSRRFIIIPRDYTASDLDPEHRLWYFREDIGVNLHHWHWHLVYPFDASNPAIVKKDRRGELFYFMHQQIVARYNFERFSNSLRRVRRFNNLREPMEEGYFPKLDSLVASRTWPGRAAFLKIRDIIRDRDRLRIDVNTLERWRDRLFEAIHQDYVITDTGEKIMLNNIKGIDILGNMIEASILSPNYQFYGNFHNMGHVFISYAHDPDHRHLESFGVMGDTTTSMRDPIFYPFHAYVDDIFTEHKMRLPPYTAEELTYPNIKITNCRVQIDNTGETNAFRTRFQESAVNLTRGLDFAAQGDVFAKFTHLNYDKFTYIINVTNSGKTNALCTARIFLGPKYDERETEMVFTDQRRMMIELDRFVISCRPGANTIRRRSTESNLTIPFERTFQDLDATPPAGTDAQQQFTFCGCGWPQHMLIPKGTPQGLACQLFVMLSNYLDDRVEQDLVGTCNDAFEFCGVRNRRYPDRKPMGYPFDRLPRDGVDDLNGFLTPNMTVTDCFIYNNDTYPNSDAGKTI